MVLMTYCTVLYCNATPSSAFCLVYVPAALHLHVQLFQGGSALCIKQDSVFLGFLLYMSLELSVLEHVLPTLLQLQQGLISILRAQLAPDIVIKVVVFSPLVC